MQGDKLMGWTCNSGDMFISELRHLPKLSAQFTVGENIGVGDVEHLEAIKNQMADIG